VRPHALYRCVPRLRGAARVILVLSLLGTGTHTRGANVASRVDDYAVLADAIVVEASGKAKEAASRIAQHTFESTNEATAAALRGRMLDEMDDAESWSVYERALARHPADALLNLRFGIMSVQQGDYMFALLMQRRSWEASPTPEAAYFLGFTYTMLSVEPQARKYFVHAVVLDGGKGGWRKKAARELAHLRNLKP
jgi:hypothetical protein